MSIFSNGESPDIRSVDEINNRLTGTRYVDIQEKKQMLNHLMTRINFINGERRKTAQWPVV